MDRGVGSLARAAAKAETPPAVRKRGGRWLTPYKKRGDPRTLIDLAELPEAMRRAGRPGPKPKRER